MDFRRSLSIQEYDSWLELGESLQGCNPQSDEADAVIWALEPKNHFPTKSLYRFLTNRGAPSMVAGLRGGAWGHRLCSPSAAVVPCSDGQVGLAGGACVWQAVAWGRWVHPCSMSEAGASGISACPAAPRLFRSLFVISLFGDLYIFTYFQNYCGCTVLGFGFGELFLWIGS
jgi:hypothetical protein